MKPFSIYVLGNNSPTSLNLVENEYLLGDGDVMFGRENNLPVLKNIGGIAGYQDNIVKDFKYYRYRASVPSGTPHTFNIKSWIADTFYEPYNEYNTGVSFIADAYFTFNHYYSPILGTKTHYAGSMHRRISFTIYRPNVGNVWKWSGVNMVSQNGVWVKYDSTSTIYGSILDSGEFREGGFEITLDNQMISGVLVLKIENKLQSETGFSALPVYQAECEMRLQAYELSTDNYTVEIKK